MQQRSAALLLFSLAVLLLLNGAGYLAPKPVLEKLQQQEKLEWEPIVLLPLRRNVTLGITLGSIDGDDEGEAEAMLLHESNALPGLVLHNLYKKRSNAAWYLVILATETEREEVNYDSVRARLRELNPATDHYLGLAAAQVAAGSKTQYCKSAFAISNALMRKMAPKLDVLDTDACIGKLVQRVTLSNGTAKVCMGA